MRYDLMAPTRQYEQGGENKTAWTKCGVMFTNDQGEPSSIVLEALPTVEVDRETGQQRAWSGRLQVFKPRERDQQPRQRQQSGGGAPSQPSGDDFSDIPFIWSGAVL